MAMQNSDATNQPHGVKRSADDRGESLDGEQRLSKRFNLLNLERNSKLWMPPPNMRPVAMRKSSTDAPDFMQVEDTKHKVYIHDLDEELAAVAREEFVEPANAADRVIFLPDIEKQLSKIPAQLLSEPSSTVSTGNEIVVYSVPSSLSVPVEKDSVRKAILDSRARARAQQIKDIDSGQNALSQDCKDATTSGCTQTHGTPYDEDAMDIGQ